jgi:hypothetical protein
LHSQHELRDARLQDVQLKDAWLKNLRKKDVRKNFSSLAFGYRMGFQFS